VLAGLGTALADGGHSSGGASATLLDHDLAAPVVHGAAEVWRFAQGFAGRRISGRPDLAYIAQKPRKPATKSQLTPTWRAPGRSLHACSVP